MNREPDKKSNTKNHIILALILIAMIAFGYFAYMKSKAPHAHEDGNVHSH